MKRIVVLKPALAFILIFQTIPGYSQADNVGSGRALSFNGINQYIDLGNIYDDLALPITVSAWVKLDGNPGALPILVTQDNDDVYNGFWFFVSRTNVWLEIGDGQGSDNPVFRRGKIATADIQAGIWHHVCVVMRSSNDADIYVNGINVGGENSGESNLPMSSNFPADVAKIGYLFSNNVNYWFRGAMDDVRLYNIPLSQSQVRATMCKKLTGSETGLIGHWDFNETSGNTIHDKSPNGFNGTIINAPNRIYSGAPVGDESIFLYPGNWNGAQLIMNESGETVTVSNVATGNHGVHAYVVRNAPSQSAGLDQTVSVPPYFGVFVAGLTTGQKFNITYSSGQCIKARHDNSIASWTDRFLMNISDRTEFIRSPLAETFNVNLGANEEVCPFPQKILQPFANPAGYSFLWQDGSTQSSFTPETYGTYWVIASKGCQTDVDSITFTKAEYVIDVDLGDDISICPLPPATLRPLPNPTGYQFKWQDESTNPELTVSGYGKYWVSVTSDCASGSDTIRFSKKEFSDLFIPNIITPNNDGYNQHFVIGNRESGEQLLGAKLEIFNRWGKKVYSTTAYENNWAGEGLQSGIYYYFIQSVCIGEKKGWLTVKK